MTSKTSKFSKGYLVLAALIALASSPVWSDHHEFDCSAAMTGTVAERQTAARQLLTETWDTARLGCGAAIMVAIADQNKKSLDDQLAALSTNAQYIYYLDRIVLYELGYLIVSYTTDVPQETMINQPMIDLQAAQDEQVRLLQRADEMGFEDPRLDYFQALTKGPTADAKPLLEAVLAADPPALKGAAHAMLGEIYYALPDIAGGDLDHAIALMRVAHERAPDNPYYSRLLAAWLLDIGDQEESRAILASLLELDAEPGELQLLADQLRIAGDIAGRVPDKALVQTLARQRAAMLQEYPYLQSRKVVVALGHFGDANPMED